VTCHILADVALLGHLGFILFGVLGGVKVRRRRRTLRRRSGEVQPGGCTRSSGRGVASSSVSRTPNWAEPMILTASWSVETLPSGAPVRDPRT